MKSASANGNLRLLWITSAMVSACLAASGVVGAQEPATKTASAVSVPAGALMSFDTPQQAADALVDAAEKFDVVALTKFFGAEGDDIVLTGEIRARPAAGGGIRRAGAREEERFRGPEDRDPRVRARGQ